MPSFSEIMVTWPNPSPFRIGFWGAVFFDTKNILSPRLHKLAWTFVRSAVKSRATLLRWIRSDITWSTSVSIFEWTITQWFRFDNFCVFYCGLGKPTSLAAQLTAPQIGLTLKVILFKLIFRSTKLIKFILSFSFYLLFRIWQSTWLRTI